MEKLSPSKLSTWEQCPYKWKKHYIDKIWPPQSEAAKKGSEIHSYLELLLRNSLGTQIELPDLKYPEIEVLHKNINKILGDYRKAKDIYLEKEHSIVYKDKIILSGNFDRVYLFDNYAEITDYKTGKFFEYLDDINTNNQFLMYTYIANNIYKKPIVFKIIQINSKDVYSEAFSKPISFEVLDTKIENYLRGVSSGEFEPKKNKFCNWCYFKDECPLFNPKSVSEIVPNLKKEEDMNQNDYVSTSLSYSVKTKKGNIISLKAEISKSIKEGQTHQQVFDECWKEVEKQIENQMSGLDLEVL